MRLSTLKSSILLLAGFIVIAGSIRGASTAPRPAPPNPIVFLLGQEPFSTGGKNFIRYNYEVMNRAEFPNDMFASSPELPPCGKNTKASRTWVDIFDQSGKRLYGFCALGKSDDLKSIWFALETDVVPPSYIYIELNDRKTNTKYKSNLADTTM